TAPAGTPFASVVICSRDRAESLARTLGSALALDYPGFEIVVVDNAPDTPGTGLAVDSAGSDLIRYVAEPLPGLSRARNRGLREARGEIVAFTDDDVVVDAQWLRRLASGFSAADNVGCVTGLVPTAELRTEQQQIFDDSVNWSRAIERRVYDLGEHRAPGALFPYRTGRLGTGANFAVARAAAIDVGPFDEALGAGSPAGGGEDLDYFLRLIDHGWAIAVEPAAIAWHYHRADAQSLERQFYSYGSGAIAYGFKHALQPERQFYSYGSGAIAYGFKHALQPRHALRLASQSAAGAASASRRGVARADGAASRATPPSSALPSSLRRAKWRGRLAGPGLYLKGRIRARGWEPLGALAERPPQDSPGADPRRNMSASERSRTDD
ncbi:MAG: glycosyltransferase, partial [Actinobacteria bacterium]|nr:glycosyltransferase [Actinomycetota bacterium]